MREIEKSAPSVEEAIEAALAELGVSEQEAQVEVVQEPRSGFLGIASQPATVRVRARTAAPAESPAQEPATREVSSQEEPEIAQQADIAADFLDDLLERMDLQAEVDITTVEEGTYVEIWGVEGGEDMGLLIGRHGAVLEALQELVRSVVQAETGERCRVLVDVEDYRKRRRDRIVQRAREVGRRVSKSGRPESLDPMNAYERKIVHDTIAQMSGLETASEGEEPDRRVVVRRAR